MRQPSLVYKTILATVVYGEDGFYISDINKEEGRIEEKRENARKQIKSKRLRV